MQITTKTSIFNSNSLHILYLSVVFHFYLIISNLIWFAPICWTTYLSHRLWLYKRNYRHDKNDNKKILIKKAKVFRWRDRDREKKNQLQKRDKWEKVNTVTMITNIVNIYFGMIIICLKAWKSRWTNAFELFNISEILVRCFVKYRHFNNKQMRIRPPLMHYINHRS